MNEATSGTAKTHEPSTSLPPPGSPRLLDSLRDALRVRHYGLRTEKTYSHWVCRYVRYHGLRHPRDMGATEINAFLTHLARDLNVAASTQTQALCALVFLYLRSRHGIHRPEGLTVRTAEGFLVFLSEKNVSWSWMASAITVLRTAFDKLGGMEVTARMTTPRRNWPLPESLSERELRLLFNVLPNPRDRLLCALPAGCGLRVSEACRIRWIDFDCTSGELRIDDPSGLRSRTVAVPRGLLPLFEGLGAISRKTDPMIAGRARADAPPTPLSVRQAERLIQAAGKRAEILKRVSPQILRNSYALRRLIAGDNIREVQVALGHHCVRTTLRYQACILPKVVGPADPEPAEVTLKRLAQVLERLSTYAETMASAGFAKGP